MINRRALIAGGAFAAAGSALPARAGQPGDKPTFRLLEREAEVLARESTGIGFDVPVWLIALEEEVARAREENYKHGLGMDVASAVEHVVLSRKQVHRKLQACSDN